MKVKLIKMTGSEFAIESKRPQNYAIKQQRIGACQPLIRLNTILPYFFYCSTIFLLIGISALYLSSTIQEFTIDYTHCRRKEDQNISCAQYIAKHIGGSCNCQLAFTLENDMLADVFLYYALDNYYQNHRLYINSRDDRQLLGDWSKEPYGRCEPFAYADNGKAIVPCGTIANSIFNDTLILFKDNNEVPLLNTGIAWRYDKQVSFRNPPGDLRTALKDYAKPKYWQKELWQLDMENDNNNGLQNEDLIVWMRTAALNKFRKIYRRVDHNHSDYRVGLKSGYYAFHVIYQYPVIQFKGSKRVILSNTSVLGAKNPFLGIFCTSVAIIFCLLGFFVLCLTKN